MLVSLDLQRFAGEDDVDIDSMLEEFESEWQDEEVEGEESTEVEQEADQEAEETEETPVENEDQPNPNDDDAEKRNRAFADLRREAEANRKYAEFINRLAAEGGVSPEDLLARYEERQLQAEAEKQQVPVDVLKRLNTLEQENFSAKEQLRAERMDLQVNQAIQKYGASDDDIRDTFKYMMETGIDPRQHDNVDFEKFYRAANLDKIIQKEVENARQKDLDNKKKRQESASIGNGSSVSPSNGTDWSDDDFNAELARLGLRL